LVVRESACLAVEDQRALDAEFCSETTKLDGLGDAGVAAAANEIACRLDVQAVVDGAAKAEADRTATIRPAPDTMTYVTALLPVTKGVWVYVALNNSVEVVQPRCRTRYEISRPSAPVATVSFPATRVFGLSRELHPPIGQPTNGECPGLDEPAG
jgi:hypothetical protein